MSEYSIEILDESTIDEQVELYKLIFPQTEVTKEKWVYKHYRNPYGKSIIFGVIDNGRLIGLNAFMPMKYLLFSREYSAMQSCETGVLSTYRGKGIWNEILNYAMEYFSNSDYDFLMGFPNYNNSYNGFIKNDWNSICNIDNYILVNNLGSMFELFFSLNKMVKNIKFAPIASAIKFFANLKKDIIDEHVDICDSIEFKSRADDPKMKLKITDEWMKWQTKYKDFKYVQLRCRDDIIAEGIYTISINNNVKTIKLAHIFFYETQRKKTVYLKIISSILDKNRDAAYIRFWTSNKNVGKILKKIGFVHSKHKNPFIIFPIKDFSGKRMDIMNSNSWDITFLDLDY